ncbi:MAG: ABC transporter ATP-binding protein [Oscillospiraceae bacterium]|nr:ABC transporter ATP-binding protein [Oscillospiraceae bacterium]
MSMLQVEHVCKQFGGLRAVDDISLGVQKGEILGIIGPNGAGKTTFFNLITNTIRLTSGSIAFEGRDISRVSADGVAALGIARTFQNIKLFRQMSVLENVKAGCHLHTSSGLFDAILGTPRCRRDERTAAEKGMELLRRVGLGEEAPLLAGNLPYGSQRRLEIARALATDPRLLLLDEPAAGMNPAETAALMELVRGLNRDGITIVVIEHDMKFIMNLCGRIVVINHGQKLAEGAPAQISRDERVIEAYLGAGLRLTKKAGDAQ